ncbi:MAG: metalloregulator ArsR/SmtB family transcription factor [Pseudomonadota bacterium]
MDDTAARIALAALAHDSRLKIVRALARAGDQGLTAGALASALEASPSATSFHLAKLAAAGLVGSERQAREITYRLDFPALGAVFGHLLEDCCGGNAILRACCVPPRP